MKSRCVRSISWRSLFVCLCLLVTPAAFADEGSPPVQFAADEPITVAWSDGKIAFVLQNNTTADVTLAVRLEPFTHAGEVIAASEIVQSPAMMMTLPGAGSATVSLPLVVKPHLVPEPGSYASVATVASSIHGFVIRRAINLTVEDPTAAAPLAPAVASYTVRAYRLCPFAPPWCVMNCAVPIEDAPANATLPADKLGALPGSDGGALLVSLDSYTQTRGAELAYEFSSGWGLAGAYKGKVDLAPADEAQGDLELTVNVTDAIWYPILLLMIGVFITAWTQNWLGVRRPLWQIVGREANASLQVKGFSPVAGYTIQTDATRRLEEVKVEVEQLDRVWRNLLFAPDEVEKAKKRHAQIEQKLAGIELQLEYWSEKWPGKLEELRAALDKMLVAIETANRPPLLTHDQRRPICYEKAKSLGQGGELSLDQFAEKVVQVDKAIILAGKWGAWEKALAWARTRLAELQGMTPDEEKLAARALQQANSAWVDLWTAENLDDLATRQTEAEIVGAVDAVSRLQHRLPRKAVQPLEFAAGVEQEGATLPGLPVKDLPATPEARAKRAQSALRLGDRAVLGIAVVVALATGLSQLYFGKNFGSLDDWLKALTWGAGAKLGVDLVKSAMDRLFVRS